MHVGPTITQTQTLLHPNVELAFNLHFQIHNPLPHILLYFPIPIPTCIKTPPVRWGEESRGVTHVLGRGVTEGLFDIGRRGGRAGQPGPGQPRPGPEHTQGCV